MKLKLDLLVLGLSLLIIGLVVGYNAKLLFAPNTKSIILPLEILQNYEIKQAQGFGQNGEFLAVGYTGKKSFLAIYKKTPDNFQEIYKFEPITGVDYPNPLVFEKMWILNQENEEFLLTSWGETGADYFGTHPLLFTYQDGGFKLKPIYDSDLQNDPEIKSLVIQPQIMEVANAYNQEDSVQTVLSQSVETNGQTIKISFYNDDNCRACEHIFKELEFTPGKDF